MLYSILTYPDTLYIHYCYSVSGFNVSGDTTAKHSGLVQSYEELVRDYVVSGPHIHCGLVCTAYQQLYCSTYVHRTNHTLLNIFPT